MDKHQKHWEKLDNTANVFPVIASESMTNTYRISAVLEEEIDEETLQQAVDLVTPKFPGFNVRLRSGIFWYYLEENGKKAPRVVEENSLPCRFIHPNRNHSYLFKVTYYQKRINLEVFHILADGMGGITFLRELVYQYLRLAHPELQEQYGDALSDETSLNREDSFLRNFTKGNKAVYKSGRAFLIKGELLPHDGFGVIAGILPVSEMKAVVKEKYHTSMNNYVVACFIYSTYKRHRGEISMNRPIRVAVPVNLRPYFESITTKNFFVMVSAEFYPEKEDYTFQEIMDLTTESLKDQMTKENLEAIFSYNVQNEKNLIARAVPLPLKNLAIRVVYIKNALANTTTVTNIGGISVLDGYRPYIKRFYCFLPFSKGQNMKCAITSFGDEMVVCFSSGLVDTAIPCGVFRQMAEDGIHVSIETNDLF